MRDAESIPVPIDRGRLERCPRELALGEAPTKQAEEDDPIEDIVRAAGQGLVEVGKRVEGMAEPTARVVNKVLQVLKFAPLVL